MFGPTRGVGADCGAVDDERVLRQGRCQAFDDGANVRIGGDAEDDRVESRGELGERRRGLAAKLGGKFRGFDSRAIPDGLEQTGSMEIFCHGSTHGT